MVKPWEVPFPHLLIMAPASKTIRRLPLNSGGDFGLLCIFGRLLQLAAGSTAVHHLRAHSGGLPAGKGAQAAQSVEGERASFEALIRSLSTLTCNLVVPPASP